MSVKFAKYIAGGVDKSLAAKIASITAGCFYLIGGATAESPEMGTKAFYFAVSLWIAIFCISFSLMFVDGVFEYYKRKDREEAERLLEIQRRSGCIWANDDIRRKKTTQYFTHAWPLDTEWRMDDADLADFAAKVKANNISKRAGRKPCEFEEINRVSNEPALKSDRVPLSELSEEEKIEKLIAMRRALNARVHGEQEKKEGKLLVGSFGNKIKG